MAPLISAGVQIAILSVAYYYLLLFFRGTRGVQILIGLALLVVVLGSLIRIFRFEELNWLISRFSGYVAVAFVVIFQPEIRRALAELGRAHFFGAGRERKATIDNIVQAVMSLSARRTGALIAIEQETEARALEETGIALDAKVVPELLLSIFHPRGPLHDGGVIVRQNRIVAAGCVFPLLEKETMDKGLGTRHRAAIGMSEEFGAVVVVVSEETGTVSVAHKGKLTRGLDEDGLRRSLSSLLLGPQEGGNSWRKVRQVFDLTLESFASVENRQKPDKTR